MIAPGSAQSGSALAERRSTPDTLLDIHKRHHHACHTRTAIEPLNLCVMSKRLGLLHTLGVALGIMTVKGVMVQEMPFASSCKA